MPARLTKTCAKAVALLFTSLVAPLAVNLVGGSLKDVGTKPPTAATAPSPQPSAAVDRPAAPAPVIRVVAQGKGKTADEALQDAILSAVRHALAGEVGTSARREAAVLDAIRGGGSGVIRDWREVSAGRMWRLSGPVHRCEVAVEVDRRALAERVRWAEAAVRIGPPVPAHAASTPP